MEEEKKGFVVKDKRIFTEEGQATSESSAKSENKEKDVKENKQAGTEQKDKAQQNLPEVNFANLVLSLSTTALFHFGDFNDQETQKTEINLPAAKQLIDTISMLKVKTEGNLDEYEKNLIDGVLYELRMRYVKETT